MAEFGTEATFNAANTEYIASAMLDSTHVVVAYRDSGGSGHGCARVGVISGNAITWGTENTFNAASTYDCAVAALDATHFVVAYRDGGNSYYGTAIVGLVSGTTISSYGAENVYNAAITIYMSVAALDSTHFVVTYCDAGDSYYGTAIVGLVSGTTISSYGAENVYNAATTTYAVVAALDATHFVVAYRDGGNSYYGTAIVGLVSGTTISSYGAENVFNAAKTTYVVVAALDSTHFVVAYCDAGGLYYGIAIVGLVSGTTISSYGAENVYNSAGTSYISISELDSTHFVVVYLDSGNSSYGTAVVGLVSGTTISSYGAENVYNSAATMYTALANLNSSDYVVCYKDNGGANYGCSRVWGTEAIAGAITKQFQKCNIGADLYNGGIIA